MTWAPEFWRFHICVCVWLLDFILTEYYLCYAAVIVLPALPFIWVWKLECKATFWPFSRSSSVVFSSRAPAELDKSIGRLCPVSGFFYRGRRVQATNLHVTTRKWSPAAHWQEPTPHLYRRQSETQKMAVMCHKIATLCHRWGSYFTFLPKEIHLRWRTSFIIAVFKVDFFISFNHQ